MNRKLAYRLPPCSECHGTVCVTQWRKGYWLCHSCRSKAADKLWADAKSRQTRALQPVVTRTSLQSSQTVPILRVGPHDGQGCPTPSLEVRG